jgi:hypothetical protein
MAEANMTKVESSNIDAIGADGDTLIIDFKNNTRYFFSNVPLDLIQGFMNSPSKGKFFSSHIKNKFESCKAIMPKTGDQPLTHSGNMLTN